MERISHMVSGAARPLTRSALIAALLLGLAPGCAREEMAACTARGYQNDVLVRVSSAPRAALDVCVAGRCYPAEPFGKDTWRATVMELQSTEPVTVELRVGGTVASRATVTPTVTYPEGEQCTAVYRANVTLPPT